MAMPASREHDLLKIVEMNLSEPPMRLKNHFCMSIDVDCKTTDYNAVFECRVLHTFNRNATEFVKLHSSPALRNKILRGG